MDCVLRCVLQLKQGLLESLAALGRGGKVGADELFPVFVYVVVHANPPRLHSNLAYVQRWRNPMAFKDEAGCYFTHLQAAVNFLDTFGIEATWERMGFVVIVEHLLLVLKLCIDWMNADIPSAVRKSLEREKWLAQMSFKAL